MHPEPPADGTLSTERQRVSLLPIAWALGCLAAFGAAFSTVSWPFADVYSTLTDATALNWPQAIASAFVPDVEYRPLFRLAIKLSYQLFGLQLTGYRALVLTQFGVILALLIWLCRPMGWRRGIAACVALSCVAGLHASRILFGFWPVNFGSFVLILLLVSIALALDPRTRSTNWVFFPLTLVALFSLEWGVMIVAVLPVLWIMNAPGVSRRGLLWVFSGLALYLAIRFHFGTSGTSPSFHTESGFGFSELSPADLRARFEHAWVFWLYNISSNFLTVVASEPRSGVFAFVASLLNGNVPYWRWLHVGSSLLTTIVMAAALIVHRVSSERDRLVLVAGLALLVFGSLLGVPYARDRFALIAGVGYGLLVYVSFVTLLERLLTRGWMRPAVVGCLAVIAVAWSIRSAETYFQIRDTAWDFYHEWEERAAALDATPQPELLTRLRAAALRVAPADPRQDPTWTHVLFERKFPIGASRPLSPPFDIRWSPEVTDEARRRLEGELGLTEARQVLRDPRLRTWSYRLRRPTRGRVRAILKSAVVEDTAQIDTARLEIVE